MGVSCCLCALLSGRMSHARRRAVHVCRLRAAFSSCTMFRDVMSLCVHMLCYVSRERACIVVFFEVFVALSRVMACVPKVFRGKSPTDILLLFLCLGRVSGCCRMPFHSLVHVCRLRADFLHALFSAT